MSYRTNSLGGFRGGKTSEDTDRRQQQPQYGYTDSATSYSAGGIRHSWQQADDNTVNSSASYRSTGSGTSGTSAYPHSQAWAPPASSRSSTTTTSQQPTRAQLEALRDYLNSGGPVPVPSKEQVHDYLVAHTKRPEGLNSPLFTIHGHRFDVYLLFKLVMQQGGSSSVTRNERWPIIAAGLQFPLEPLPGSQILRSSSKIGIDLREFFLRVMGGLEILWEKTKSASREEGSGRRDQSRPTSLAQPRATWSTQAGTSNSHLPTPTTGYLQVSDLTLPQSATSARDNYYNSNNTNSQDYASSSYPYSQQSTYPPAAAAPRPTPSPVDNAANGSASYGNGHSASAAPAAASEYEPPVVADFDQLVHSQLLPLPVYGGNAPLPHFTSSSLEYAWRAHELRASIRKMSAAEQHRTVTSEEIQWWNRLVTLLQKNPKVVIPRPPSGQNGNTVNQSSRNDSPETRNLPTTINPTSITINPTSIHHLVQQPVRAPAPPAAPVLEPAQPEPEAEASQTTDAPPKKKRVKKPKNVDPPGGAGDGADGLSSVNTAAVPVKKKRSRATHDAEGNPIPKKPRGRPKKSVDGGALAAGDDGASIAAVSSASQPVNANGTSSAPSGSATTAVEPAASSASAPRASTSSAPAAVSDPLIHPPMLPPKKKRGRPKKPAPFIGPLPAPVPSSPVLGDEQAHQYLQMIAAREAHNAKVRATPVEVFPIIGAGGRPVATAGPGPSSAAHHTMARVRGGAFGSFQLEQQDSSGSLSNWAQSYSQLAANLAPPKQPKPRGRPPVVDTPESIKARYDKLATLGNVTVLTKGRPKKLIPPPVVVASSPKRVLFLSSSRKVQAQMSQRDRDTPTKVVFRKIRRTWKRKSGLFGDSEPATLADAMAEPANIEDEEDDFGPFAELSQVAPPSPPKFALDDFTEYTPVKSWEQRRKEQELLDAVDAAAAMLNDGQNDQPADMDVPMDLDLGDAGIAEDAPLQPQSRPLKVFKGKERAIEIVIPRSSQPLPPIYEQRWVKVGSKTDTPEPVTPAPASKTLRSGKTTSEPVQDTPRSTRSGGAAPIVDVTPLTTRSGTRFSKRPSEVADVPDVVDFADVQDVPDADVWEDIEDEPVVEVAPRKTRSGVSLSQPTPRRTRAVSFVNLTQNDFTVTTRSGSRIIPRGSRSRADPVEDIPATPATTRSAASQKAASAQKAPVPPTTPKTPKRARAGSEPSQRVTRSTPVAKTPAPRLTKKPAPRHSTPVHTGSHMTRSIAGPPAASLRARPKPSPLSQSFVPKKAVAKPAPVRKERFLSIEAIEDPDVTYISGGKKRKGPVVVEMTEEEREEAKARRLARGAVDRVKVVIPIRRAHRRRLILLGRYNAFRDDDSDSDEDTRAMTSLRPVKSLPNRFKSRSIRAREPEVIKNRFEHRPGPALLEPYKTVMNPVTFLKRLSERDCGWKGCDAVLGSEELLQKHIVNRKHTSQASFKVAPHNVQTLWKCHWYACEGPCFETEQQLSQHVTAKHVSRVLRCPYGDCTITSPDITHLARHAMRQHDEAVPQPLADLTHQLPPSPLVPPPLPDIAHTDELTTHRILGSVYRSQSRRDWAKLRVANHCFSGEEPILHVRHPPHILDATGADEEDAEAEEEEGKVLYDAKERAERVLLDKAQGRSRKWEAVVFIPKRRKEDVRWMPQPVEDVRPIEVFEVVDDADDVGDVVDGTDGADTVDAGALLEEEEEAMNRVGMGGTSLADEEMDEDEDEDEDDEDDADDADAVVEDVGEDEHGGDEVGVDDIGVDEAGVNEVGEDDVEVPAGDDTDMLESAPQADDTADAGLADAEMTDAAEEDAGAVLEMSGIVGGPTELDVIKSANDDIQPDAVADTQSDAIPVPDEREQATFPESIAHLTKEPPAAATAAEVPTENADLIDKVTEVTPVLITPGPSAPLDKAVTDVTETNIAESVTEVVITEETSEALPSESLPNGAAVREVDAAPTEDDAAPTEDDALVPEGVSMDDAAQLEDEDEDQEVEDLAQIEEDEAETEAVKGDAIAELLADDVGDSSVPAGDVAGVPVVEEQVVAVVDVVEETDLAMEPNGDDVAQEVNAAIETAVQDAPTVEADQLNATADDLFETMENEAALVAETEATTEVVPEMEEESAPAEEGLGAAEFEDDLMQEIQAAMEEGLAEEGMNAQDVNVIEGDSGAGGEEARPTSNEQEHAGSL